MVTMRRTRVAALGLVIAAAGCELVAGVRSDVGPYPAGSGGGAGTGGGAASTCGSGKKDGDETGKDCGGSCAVCPDGEGCKNGGDCASKSCGPGGTCAAAACDDKVRNGDETDVDCGGKTCGPCAFGKGCVASTDCVTAFCNGETCDAQTIVAGLTNPNSVVADSKNVYWADGDLGVVMMADIATGTPIEMASGLGNPRRLVGQVHEPIDLNPTLVFWVESDKVSAASGGPDPYLVTNLVVSGGIPQAITEEGRYWTNQGPPSNPNGNIMTRNLGNPMVGSPLVAIQGAPGQGAVRKVPK